MNLPNTISDINSVISSKITLNYSLQVKGFVSVS